MYYKMLVYLIVVLLLQSCSTIFQKPGREFPAPATQSFQEAPLSLDSLQGTFYQNIAYGKYTRNVFDLLVPKSDKPVPLVIYIHGGGFLHGSKEGAYSDDNGEDTPYDEYFTSLLKNGVALASINYRFLQNRDTVGVIKCLEDGKRCLQFIRYHAAEYHIDADNIQLCGNSAGAGIAFWVGLQNDMADPTSNDPVLQQSTRVKSIAVIATQSTYDLERWTAEILSEYNPENKNHNKAFVKNPILRPFLKRMMLSFYGISSKKEVYTEACLAYRKKLDFMSFMSADDPEIYIENLSVPLEKPQDFNVMFHHAYHARALHQQADAVGLKNVCRYHGCEESSDETFVSFMLRKAGE